MKEALRYLIVFGAIAYLLQPLAHGAFEDKKYEELKLINPNETLKDVTLRKAGGFRTIIFHSEGVMNAKPDRFSEEMLEELNYDLDEWAEYEKKSAETSKRMRIEYEKRRAEEEKKKETGSQAES